MMFRTRLVMILPLIAALFASTGDAPARAHPLGNFTINRFSEIRAGLEQVAVLYVVDMAEIPTFQERARIDLNRDGEADAAELDAYARSVTPRLSRSLSLRSAGEVLPLRVEGSKAELRPGQGGLEVLRIELRLRADLPIERMTLEYRDRNFSGRLGWKEIVARGIGGQGLERASVPSVSVSDRLTSYPKDLLSSPLSVTEARVVLAPDAPAIRDRAQSEVPEAPIDFVGGWFSSLIERELSLGFAFAAVGLALAAGALHALGPGHGKTIMAAYLVGADGRVRHAVMIGIAVSLMHTTSVIGLGLVTLWASSLLPPETVFPWLSLVSGLVVLALGLWLLVTRLRAPARSPQHSHSEGRSHSHEHGPPFDHSHEHGPPFDHSHEHGPPFDHSDEHELVARSSQDGSHGALQGGRTGVGVVERTAAEHGHSHAPPPGASPFSGRGLAAVALSGGLLPSPSALVVLLGAMALHRVAFGLVLVAAFSIGLAATLAGVGVVVLQARAAAARRLGTRAGTLIPIGSASLIVAVGTFLTTRALIGL
jgi:nickel/cobalt transporter (NicO) family protein